MTRLALALVVAAAATAAPVPGIKEDLLVVVSNRSGSANLFAVAPDGTTAKNLTDSPAENSYPAWSPDGKAVAFASNRDGTMHVYRMDADGSNVKQLTKGDEMCRVPTWSADGKTIAFCRAVAGGGSRIYTVPAGGGEMTPVGDGDGWDPAFSPDGKKIAFTSFRKGDGFRLYVMDADGSNVAELSDTPNTFGYVYPAWSPDGKQLAWTQPTDDGLDIYTVGADGKGAKRLTKLGGLTTYAAWSPDGKTIAFYHTKENEKGAYYRVDPSGDNLKPFLKDELPVEGGRPAWRPRGK